MIATFRAFRFLAVGPLALLVLFAVNLLTSPGHWWIVWPALGIGLAWCLSLLRVLRALVLVGGAAALVAYLRKK